MHVVAIQCCEQLLISIATNTPHYDHHHITTINTTPHNNHYKHHIYQRLLPQHRTVFKIFITTITPLSPSHHTTTTHTTTQSPKLRQNQHQPITIPQIIQPSPHHHTTHHHITTSMHQSFAVTAGCTPAQPLWQHSISSSRQTGRSCLPLTIDRRRKHLYTQTHQLADFW